MIIISGKTFDHREQLKDLGARWNAANRNWTISSLSDTDRKTIAAMVGVMITEPLQELIEDDDDDDIELLPQRTIRHGRKEDTKIIGDDPTWFNYFEDKYPTTFFGFSSLSAMMKYIKNIPDDIAQGHHGRARARGWDIDENWFFGTTNMQHAMKLVRDGWPEGLELAEQISHQLTGRNAIERRRKYSVAGGNVNVGRMLANNPLHMTARAKQPGKKVITFFVEASMSASIEPKYAIIRAALVAAIVDILEMNGFSCEIVSTSINNVGNKAASQIATTLKAAGEPLSINDIIFGLGHPSYLRRFVFACEGSDERLAYLCRNAFGHPGNAFSETTTNEFYIEKIDHHLRHLISDRVPLIEQAMQIWELVIPDNLPIERIKR